MCFQSVIDRFEQIKPIVLFCVTQVNYNGKKHDQIQKIQEITQSIKSIIWQINNDIYRAKFLFYKEVDSIQKVIVIPFCEETVENIDNLPKR